MDLRDYLRVLRRNWIIIVAAALGGLLTGGGLAIATKPTYTAETQLFVAIQNSGSVQELQQGNTFSQARVQSYVKTVDSPLVLQPAIDTLGLSLTPDELSEKVEASTDLNTVIVKIQVKDQSPAQAASIAQAVANSLIKAVDTLEKPRTGGPSPISLSIITPATAPLFPSAPNTKLNLLMGLLIGLAFGVGGSVLKSALDTRIRSEIDLRRVTDLPLLGAISLDPSAARQPLLTQSALQSPRSESFRQLRTNLQFTSISGDTRTILVTSSLPGEGKSTTATNLAIALAQAGQTVCLVDADLRRPMVNEYLGLERNVGLTTALLGSTNLDDLLQPWGDDNLFVLTSGQIPPNPSELLGSQPMADLIGRLEELFDTVVIDTSPLLPVTDAAVLAQHAGGVVLVIGAQRARQQELQKSLDSLNLVGAKVLGVVMNLLPAKGPDAYTYSYGSYATSDVNNASKKDRRKRNRSDGQVAPPSELDDGSTLTFGDNAPSKFPRDRVPNSNSL